MTILHPWYLIGLPIIGAVAIFTLFRPARRLVNVPSLRLWREAIEAADRASTRRIRRVDLSWLLVLAGLILGVLALSRPVYFSSRPARLIAIEAGPSAEIATDKAMSQFRTAANVLLDRLSTNDKVRLVLPLSLSADGDVAWDTPQEARARIASLQPLPVAGRRLDFPPLDDEVQHVYSLVPAGTGAQGGQFTTVIEIATDLPAVTLESISALVVDGNVELLAVLRRNTGGSLPENLIVDISRVGAGAGSLEFRKLMTKPVRFTGDDALASVGARIDGVVDAIVVSVRSTSENDIARSWLARTGQRRLTVTLSGRDEPILRRYIDSDPMLRFVADESDADVVISNVYYRSSLPVDKIKGSPPERPWTSARRPLLSNTTVQSPVVRRITVMPRVPMW